MALVAEISFSLLVRYITSDCDAVAVVYEYIGYASSPEDAVADCLNAGCFAAAEYFKISCLKLQSSITAYLVCDC